jgi:hypothetical protein
MAVLLDAALGARREARCRAGVSFAAGIAAEGPASPAAIKGS